MDPYDAYRSLGGSLSELVHLGRMTEAAATDIITSIQIAQRMGPDNSPARDAMLRSFDSNLQYLRDYRPLEAGKFYRRPLQR